MWLSERVRVGVLTCSFMRFKEEKERLYLKSHAAELATLHGFVRICLLDSITPYAHDLCWRQQETCAPVAWEGDVVWRGQLTAAGDCCGGRSSQLLDVTRNNAQLAARTRSQVEHPAFF